MRLEVDPTTPTGYRLVRDMAEAESDAPEFGAVRGEVLENGEVEVVVWGGRSWHPIEPGGKGVALIEGTDPDTDPAFTPGKLFLDTDCEGGTRPPTVVISNTPGAVPKQSDDDVIGDEIVNVPDKRQWVYAGQVQGWVERPTSTGANVVESPTEPLNLAPGDFWVDSDCEPTPAQEPMQAGFHTFDLTTPAATAVYFPRRFATTPIVVASATILNPNAGVEVGANQPVNIGHVNRESFLADLGAAPAGRYTINWIAMEATS